MFTTVWKLVKEKHKQEYKTPESGSTYNFFY